MNKRPAEQTRSTKAYAYADKQLRAGNCESTCTSNVQGSRVVALLHSHDHERHIVPLFLAICKT
jgi:hypothetical protein